MMIRNRTPGQLSRWLHWAILLTWLLAACQPAPVPMGAGIPPGLNQSAPAEAVQLAQAGPPDTPTPAYTSRPRYAPGELVDYTAQGGDTLPMLAFRFNTTVKEILEANPFIPADATTMPPGMPMKIPIYYLPLWGSPYQILPDSHFVNGPAQVGFDVEQFVASQPGWLKDYKTYVSGVNRNGAQVIEFVAEKYSISPRLLLAILEYQAGVLTKPTLRPEEERHLLSKQSWNHQGLYLQLVWAATILNNNYYEYKTMQVNQIDHRDGRIERFDPWLNAASASLQIYFKTLHEYDTFVVDISDQGLAATYRRLFGDPWQNEQAHIPGSLAQPNFILPFQPGDVWALTGGPHSVWGRGEPLGALDFAPPSKTSGCVPSAVWATAVADGVVVRSGNGEVVLDLDGDGDERTGWNVYYLHIATEERAPLGAQLKQGDPLGHPSCEGGTATGTHIHIARKYNGEWLSTQGMGGVLSFNLEGWVAHYGAVPYLGTLTRHSRTVTACTCSNAASFIQSDRPE